MKQMVDEQQLMKALANPKTRRKAFETVVSQYGEQLYWQVRRIVMVHEDADDVMQNVMLKAWSNLDSFQQQSRLSTWLYRIAINESLDFVRKRQNRLKSCAEGDGEQLAARLMADPYFDGDETEALLQEAIAQLPDVQRMVFDMKYFQNMKYKEIGEILKTSEGALKASYHIAVKKITDFFSRHD